MYNFTADELKEILDKSEFELLPKFIDKMLQIGMFKIIDEWNNITEYEFTEKTFYTYYNILSSEKLFF